MNDIFQFWFTTIIDICSFEPMQYMLGISFVICIFGIIKNRL